MTPWLDDSRYQAHPHPRHPRLRLVAECAAFVWLLFLVVAASSLDYVP